ncbi:MAG: cupredoxin domain-containing protein [Gemmatimonadales bacterium]
MRLARWTVIGAAVLAACGDDYGTNGGGCQPTSSQVCMGLSTFNPTTRNVTAGTTVEWVNGSGVGHTVTNNPGSGETFNQAVGAGGTFTHQFNTPGTYQYHCMIHGTPTTGMRGTIQVNP